MSDSPDPTAVKLTGASAALLREALVSAHGVDRDYVDHLAQRHAREVPFLATGEVHAAGLAAPAL